MNSKLTIAVLALTMFVFPGVARAQNPNSDNSTHRVTGCLQKGESSSSYMLSDESGKIWEVYSLTVHLGPHVGRIITLTGTHPKQTENSANTSRQDQLLVTHLEVVRYECEQK
jgi:hypothetical protein